MNKKLEEIKQNFLWWPLIVISVIIVLDQATKLWTVAVSEDNAPVRLKEIIEGYFYFVDYRNTGAAWGLFSDHTFILALISLGAFIAFVWYFADLTEGKKFLKFSWALLIGGVFGNFIDRFFRGEVVDMILVNIPMADFMRSWPVIGKHINSAGVYPFPAFNIADSAICVGMILYLGYTLSCPKKEEADKSVSKPVDNVTE